MLVPFQGTLLNFSSFYQYVSLTQAHKLHAKEILVKRLTKSNQSPIANDNRSILTSLNKKGKVNTL